ncbi:MAG: protein translocase subunit SecF [Maricaulis sp.]|uniref:protein translocase subunit SecF n=1 Tax=Maricaulis sp. TaxID=1486257 RepID=UPI001AFED288|nr:protein translocase subunit SecF [Maricaulis sp.]MBO6729380.1 protein translocase subunit SecF [Maricaulis sp.]MBO6848241.1 protein translocase subunit SecF [Maricaulis sp.]MBO6877966.1 protein translocase subunit SecF [Maricaulis sp.]MDM7983322.1 protein translocase subunit SecF [Maricaulis sp.]
MSFALVKYLPSGTTIPFIRARMAAMGVSLLIVLGSLGVFGVVGINFGIDFRGGIQADVETAAPVDEVRALANGLGLGEAKIQASVAAPGETRSVLVTMPLQEGEGLEGEELQNEARRALVAGLEAGLDDAQILGTAVVGGAVSGELVVKGITAIVVALFLMLIYIWFRFEWQYSVGAIVALTHDVIATIGFFSITQMTFDLATVAAILTIVGYSMNDTVVVYDRIRENLRKYKKLSVEEVLNLSINDTLSRTILTSVTTLLALLALYFIGGSTLQGFSAAMIWGVLIGTYSSIFVAAPLLLFTNVNRSSEEDVEVVDF